MQTSLALVLLIGSGLLVQSFWKLSRVDPGYDTDDIFAFQIAPSGDELHDGPTYARFHQNFMDRLRALPGVESVGIVNNLPLEESVRIGRFRRDDQVGDPDAGTTLSYTFAAGDYFEAMGVDVLEGRALAPDDQIVGRGNVVISESTVDVLFAGESALGRRIESATRDATYTVVGVVADVLQSDFRESPLPMVYMPLVGQTETSWAITSPAYVVKTKRAQEVRPEIRALLREVAPSAPLYRDATMAARAAEAMVELSFTTLMLGIVSTLALILGAVGLYGVLSYVVAGRTREIGVRMALGAEAGRVQRMIVARGARGLTVGVVLGLFIAIATTRGLESLLFGVEPADPTTFAGMSLALIAVGLLACYLPALRASRVAPTEALRAE